MRLSDTTYKALLILLGSLFLAQDTFSCDPVVISGPTTICPGSTNVYTVSGISPSQLDFWSIGAQPGETAVICGFVSLTPLSVSLCVSEGYPTLCVIYDNGCEACINITVLQDPFEDFNGELTVCGGDIETYRARP